MNGLVGFEHVGMTCGDLDRTIAFYCGLLGLTLALRKKNERGEMAFLDTGSGMLEIACPDADIARSRDVPPHEAGMRHLTFAFESVDAIFEKLAAAGVELIEPPRPAYFIEMIKRVAFVRDPDGTIVELIERADRRS
ncbi:lactoylglutathione lyase [Devosia sp. Root436]|jgi:glyoxylase I family protein|uniref:VOC family protein n=1 Tax=Devosia sp. Root436 TaxID=1736537 RepID=UPI0006F291B8|nr:VOC family protein [Devosia sp. Root436]KQX34313.1 lactoylglutathione lyase [Devosia sp. Root436]